MHSTSLVLPLISLVVYCKLLVYYQKSDISEPSYFFSSQKFQILRSGHRPKVLTQRI